CIKIANKHIGHISSMTISEAIKWFEDLPKDLTVTQNSIASKIIKEISERLNFLINVGLDYLTLSRNSGTLSGGESQRIRLASQIGSGLTGVLYVLDEPSIGLHQCDNEKLIKTLRNLTDIGNSVIVVEHDEETILAADHVIDVGPGAGIHGGHIIAEGTPEDIKNNPNSITGQYLNGKKYIKPPESPRKGHEGKTLKLNKAHLNNLQNVSVEIPLGTFTSITGVSGSGKSSLIIHTIYKAIAFKLKQSMQAATHYSSISGVEYLDKIIDINQSPIGRTPRSNPATYTGAFNHIRDWFTGLPTAKARGYTASRFSFNVKGGRCENCKGDGLIKIEMHFLPDVYVPCEECNGKRYNKETLEIKYKDKSISEVLDMTVDDSKKFFEKIPAIREKLDALQDVGLGYIKIGQSATTLSGGEAQRVKLAKELSRRSTGKTVYILDEPTTGLHIDDISKLLKVLHKLVDMGNTVIVIEHNMDVIKTSDYIIDVGPGGGNKGGTIVSSGSPYDIIKSKESITGKYLKNHMHMLKLVKN
ncbi:MAG: excinuclease ABC subunit UvrA, partial [Alphaproteobacteria bacterium]|nr:excinuclease ABC subunit UvrA [Alphaproteobacteria bacterium]